jgi:hypothetical protein
MEENLQPACCSCNTYRKEFHMRGYTLFMLDFYDRGFVNELIETKKQILTPSQVRALAEEAISYYTEALKSL